MCEFSVLIFSLLILCACYFVCVAVLAVGSSGTGTDSTGTDGPGATSTGTGTEADVTDAGTGNVSTLSLPLPPAFALPCTCTRSRPSFEYSPESVTRQTGLEPGPGAGFTGQRVAVRGTMFHGRRGMLELPRADEQSCFDWNLTAGTSYRVRLLGG